MRSRHVFRNKTIGRLGMINLKPNFKNTQCILNCEIVLYWRQVVKKEFLTDQLPRFNYKPCVKKCLNFLVGSSIMFFGLYFHFCTPKLPIYHRFSHGKHKNAWHNSPEILHYILIIWYNCNDKNTKTLLLLRV